MGLCCDTQSGLISMPQALEQMDALLETVTGIEQLELEQALGRILALDLVSPINVPPFANSAMDGYALRASDLQESKSLIMVGKSFAGEAYEGTLEAGQCIRIMTGAPIPEGADSVVMQEQTSRDGEQISFLKPVKVQQNIRLSGEDMQQGQVVLKAGHRLTVRDVQLIASLGLAQVKVYKKLKVAVFSTGDELQAAGKPLEVGQIYDSNRTGIIALLKRMDIEVLDFGVVGDDVALLKKCFIQADLEADVVMTSGGVSVGEADYTKMILEQLGEVGFWKLAIKPGKPFAFGRLAHSVFFGLPGNPVSAMVTLHQLAVPALAKLMGWNKQAAPKVLARALHKIKKSAGRIDFQRGIYSLNAQGELQVETTGHQGSGVFTSLSRANCYIVLEQDRDMVLEGEVVWIELFESLLD